MNAPKNISSIFYYHIISLWFDFPLFCCVWTEVIASVSENSCLNPLLFRSSGEWLKLPFSGHRGSSYSENIFFKWSNNIIIRCKCFFLFIGGEPTMWPANNSLLMHNIIQLCLAANNILLMHKWNHTFHLLVITIVWK